MDSNIDRKRIEITDMRSRRVLFHFFITIVFIIFLFYSVNQKKVEMTIYNIILPLSPTLNIIQPQLMSPSFARISFIILRSPAVLATA